MPLFVVRRQHERGESMDKKLLFIYNPKSGKTQIKSRLSDILDLFVKQGYLVTVYPTQKSRDAMRISRELAVIMTGLCAAAVTEPSMRLSRD